MVTALSLSQSGTACSPTILIVGVLSMTECAPAVNSVALLSVGEPLRNTTFDGLPAKAVDQALALQLTDLGVVEGDVGVSGSAQGQPVVVDGLHPLAGRLLLDRGTAVGVEVDDRQYGHPVGDHAVGDGGHVVGRALGVLNRVRHACGLERRLERGPVLGLPPHRRLGVGQDHADLARLRLAAATTAAAAAARGEAQTRPPTARPARRTPGYPVASWRSLPSFDLLFETTYNVTHVTSRPCGR